MAIISSVARAVGLKARSERPALSSEDLQALIAQAEMDHAYEMNLKYNANDDEGKKDVDVDDQDQERPMTASTVKLEAVDGWTVVMGVDGEWHVVRASDEQRAQCGARCRLVAMTAPKLAWTAVRGDDGVWHVVQRVQQPHVVEREVDPEHSWRW